MDQSRISYTKISENSINIVLAGPSQSGKSSILGRFTRNEFKEEMLETTGIDYTGKLIYINGMDVLLKIVK